MSRSEFGYLIAGIGLGAAFTLICAMLIWRFTSLLDKKPA